MKRSKKHAYLIIAHNQFDLLEKLVRLLDDKRNDIFLHIDIKANDFNKKYFKQIPKYSKIYFTERTDVRWGDYSQINSEYVLFKCAKEKGNYSYYHILSGVDLPLKTQDYIHDFFDNLKNKEVIQLVDDKLIKERNAYYRISRFHFFTKYEKSNNKIIKNAVKIFNNIFMPLQTIFHIDRLHKKLKIGYGANWVSITDDFVNYILSKEDWVKKIFKYSLCGDELFIQTLLVNSPFKDNVYCKRKSLNFNGNPCLRYIDWEHGNPYVFKNNDFGKLKKSNMMFARKFDINKYPEIVDKLYKYLKK